MDEKSRATLYVLIGISVWNDLALCVITHNTLYLVGSRNLLLRSWLRTNLISDWTWSHFWLWLLPLEPLTWKTTSSPCSLRLLLTHLSLRSWLHRWKLSGLAHWRNYILFGFSKKMMPGGQTNYSYLKRKLSSGISSNNSLIFGLDYWGALWAGTIPSLALNLAS